MKIIGLVLRGLRYRDEILEIGDLAIHDEEAFPTETAVLTGGAGGMSASMTADLSPPGEPDGLFNRW